MLLKLAAEALGQPEVRPGIHGYWVLVLIDHGHIKSVHCHIDETPTKPGRVWDTISQRGAIREIWVQAENIKDALDQALKKGILVLS